MNKLRIHILGRFLIAITLVCTLSVSTLGGVSQVGASPSSSESQTKENNEGTFQVESQTYDDTDAAWTYTGYWSTDNPRRAYGGRIHLSNAAEDQASISVMGSSFTVFYSTAPNYGKLDVFVDNVKIHTINQGKSRTSHQNKWLSPEFALGIHVLKFVHATGKVVNVDAIKVRALQANISPTPAGGDTIAVTPTSMPAEFPGATSIPTLVTSPTPSTMLPADNPTLIPSATSTSLPSPTPSQIPSPLPSLTPAVSPTSPALSSPTVSGTFTPTNTATVAPLPTIQTSGNIYYASSNGSGTTCSASAPCSLAAGISRLVAGDTLYLKSGVYLQASKLSISQSGTQNARITIAKDPSDGGVAVISGDVNSNGIVDQTDGPRTADPVTYHEFTPLVNVSGSYITLKGIEISFSSGRGTQSGGTNNILSGLNVHHTWTNAIYVLGPYNLVENNRIWRGAEINYCGGVGGRRNCNGSWSAGLNWGATSATTAPGPAHHLTVRGNTVYNNSGEGMVCVHSDYATVENNIVYDNWGLGIDIDKCAYETVQNNLIYYSADTSWWRSVDSAGNPVRPHSGILISNEAVGQGDAYPLGHDRKIINNIIVGAGIGITFWPGDGSGGEFDQSRLINDLIAHNSLIEAQNNGTGIRIYNPPLAGLAHTNTRIVNNLILQSSGTLANVDTTAGLTFDHNLWSRTPPPNVGSLTDVVADPRLVDPNHTRLPGAVIADWYKLTSGSPAINMGTYLSQVTRDYFSTTRSNPPDIGAHDYE